MNSVKDSLLVVDDNEMNRDGLSLLLGREGYAVTVGSNGQQALELMSRQPFDLVLLDVMMADLNGLDVLKDLRASRSATELPVIMTTARGQSEDIVEALKLGANDYVTKPIDFPVLLARIQTQLAHKHAVERIIRLEQNLTLRNEELQAANTKLRAANARMKQDLLAAARIQEAFLPAELSRLPGVHFSWIFQPCEQLAGDMLNVFALDEDHLGMYVLDVSGHGVAAALLSVTLSHMLSPRRDPTSLLIQSTDVPNGERLLGPAEVADLLTSRFPWDPATEQYFTMVYGILNVKTGELRYASAGHPGMVCLPRDAAPLLLEQPSLPVGVGPPGYKEYTASLRPGDRLFLYSDGVVEAMNPENEQFGKARLLAAVDQGRAAPLKGALELLLGNFEQWGGASPRRDDVSILAVEYAGCPTRKPRDRPRLSIASSLGTADGEA